MAILRLQLFPPFSGAEAFLKNVPVVRQLLLYDFCSNLLLLTSSNIFCLGLAAALSLSFEPNAVKIEFTTLF